MNFNKVLVGAIDQGTSSSRFLIFDTKTSELVTYHQIDIKASYPEKGWVEEDPLEILDSINACIDQALDNLIKLDISPLCIQTIGITNQRETTVAFDISTGKPLHNAIVWLDTRTTDTVNELLKKIPGRDKNHLKPRCGLPLSTYFSAVKMKWLIDSSEKVQSAMRDGVCRFSTVDSWLLWNLTGGSKSGKFLTDVTNASRTMLMNIYSLTWDPVLLEFFGIPQNVLPEIRSSCEIYGRMSGGKLDGVPISGILGDQQAALYGHGCLSEGQAKNTYGTGCFMLCSTGTQVISSKRGLLSTVAYKAGPNKPTFYALEGSVAIAGAATNWLRDNMGIIKNTNEFETLAKSVSDTQNCYFVPAFSGLFFPYWESHARGIICGLSQSTTKAHLARATLEAICFQTVDVLEAIERDMNITLKVLNVDGGMSSNNLLLEMQADLLGVPVVRPSMLEMTALGVAKMAGQAEGVAVWNDHSNVYDDSTNDVFVPLITTASRRKRYMQWNKAIARSKNWELPDDEMIEADPREISSMFSCALFTVTSLAMYVFSELVADGYI
ncbi:hypothetical protein HELRODRAFT_93977 [Helobdella robusta]|uniref:Probable glycerol kinase n=1 Tax=Helobdella robusta TaxID=6412 RepID=T1G8Y4_HELRO|nr:hypothetical protein HELRODRAFT_93977 [Helobdella robusta]ESO06194.1 hypothetical protein HELRODRAFT_93977 [Helobdella robusta]